MTASYYFYKEIFIVCIVIVTILFKCFQAIMLYYLFICTNNNRRQVFSPSTLFLIR